MITIQRLFTILVIILSLSCHLASTERAIRCKYVLIEKSYYQKVQSQSTTQTIGDSNSNSNSFFFQKQFNFGISGRVELLKSHLVKWHVDDCLNSNILDRIDVVNNVFRANSDSVDSRQFSLYGVDLSSNQLTDNEFESILNTNPLFRYNLNLIRYLNLATNKLARLNSNISRFNDELDEFNFLNDESTSFLRPNQTGYLLGRFFNLETLVVDDNSLLSVSVADLMAVLPKLKVLSASRCSPTIAQRQIVHSSINPKSLVYLGLSGNKISDPSLDDYLPTRQLNVDSLDLSFNKLSNLTNVLVRLARVNRLNLEKNLIEALRVGDIISLEVSKSISEINLRSNFIQNTSVENFKFDDKSTNIRPIGVRLAGNPLICDCQSIWLLDLVKDMITNSQQQQPQAQAAQQPQTPRTQILNRKRPKSSSNGDHIKLVYRRDMEVISYYHNIDQDPNLTTFMQRQKRLNATGSSQEKKLELLAAKFLDLDQLTCSFIDVQDSQYSSHHQHQKRPNSQQLVNIERSPQAATDYDMSSSLDYFISDSTGQSNQEPIEIKQKLNVGSIRYREKLLSSSTHQDFMCQYDDHCRLDLDCDCCVFQHCHCRSICPSKCRCYFDASKSQNIIDCSQSNLIDVPSEQPIESATDMRLNSNNLKMLKAYAFFGYGSIKYLYLQDNQISAVNRNAFDDLKPTLRVINLANNQLDYLHGDEFKGFVDLEVIVLSHNPLKQIESFSFLVAADSLPKLKLLYASKTQLGSEQMTKFTAFAKANSNATVKFRERRLLPTSSAPSNIASKVALGPINKSAEEYAINNSTSLTKRRQQQQELTTPKTIINIEETPIEEQTESETEPTNTWESKPPMRSPLDFLPLNSLLTTNIYIISGSIIVVCLLLSLFILSIVMCIIRRIERGQKRRRRDRRSKSDKKKSGKHVVENGALSYYITSPEDDELSSSDDDDDDSSSEDETSTTSYRGGKRWLSCFCRRSAPNSFDASSPSSSYFDSTSSSSSNAATDAASVPVSRSLEHTSLYVYVYFSEFDAHYANNYLLPCLHKCLTIVPDTRFVMCSQRDKHAWDEAATVIDSTPDSIRTTSRSTSTQRRTAAAATRRLVARILVVSENFFGLRLNAESCLTSSSSSDRSLVTAKIASASNPHHHNHRANNKHLNIFRIYLFNNNINGTMINSNGQQTNDSNNSSNSGEMIATTTSSSNKLNSFNKRLMRRLFETSPTQTTMNGTHNPNHHYQHSISTNNRLCSSQAIATMNQLNIMNNMNYPNDAFSSYAYNDRLQCKLEKFLEYVCLKKSNSFSKTTNFSYVDYTKTKR